MAAILNFRNFANIGKHKFASISLTVRDRAISSNLSKLVCNFQKNFARKMTAILNFRIFAKNAKHKFASSLLNCAR